MVPSCKKREEPDRLKGGDKKKKKEKSNANPPSHTKTGSHGPAINTVNLAKKTKSNIEPRKLKMERNMPSTSNNERKVKVLPEYPPELKSFLDALKFPPLPNIRIMKKKPTMTMTSPTASQGDKDNIKTCGVKRPRSGPSDAPPSKKKYEHVNMPSTSRESKMKVTQAHPNVGKVNTFREAVKQDQRMEGQAFKVARRQLHNTIEESVPSNPSSTKQPPVLAKPMGKPHGVKRPRSGPSDAPPSKKKYEHVNMPSTSRESNMKVTQAAPNVGKVNTFREAVKPDQRMEGQAFKVARRQLHNTIEESVPSNPSSTKQPPVLAKPMGKPHGVKRPRSDPSDASPSKNKSEHVNMPSTSRESNMEVTQAHLNAGKINTFEETVKQDQRMEGQAFKMARLRAKLKANLEGYLDSKCRSNPAAPAVLLPCVMSSVKEMIKKHNFSGQGEDGQQ